MPADPEDAALPAFSSRSVGANALEASFLKSVFAELSGRPVHAPDRKAGAPHASADIACARDSRRK